VRGSICVPIAGCVCPRQFDRLAGHIRFRQATLPGDALDGVAIAVPGRKIHESISVLRVRAQNAFDHAIGLDELAPIDGAQAAEAADAVADRDLVGGLLSRLEQLAENPLTLNQGTLYPALVRLEQRGWIKGTWRQTESRREAKYYAITPAGRRAVEDQAARWRRLSALVNRLLLDEG